ncbi:unnamed protein product, partial [Rotaria sp. Silwood2]
SRTTQEIAIEEPDDIKAFILRSIKRWCGDNKAILKLRDFQLQETEHFTLNFTDDGKIFITCKCGEKINLYKFRGKFQLSNFYRHYKASSCSMLENLQKEEQEKQNYRMLSAIAATLPPSDSRALLLSSAQNPNGLDMPNSPSTSLPTELSINTTSKRRADAENSNNIVSTSKKQKK